MASYQIAKIGIKNIVLVQKKNGQCIQCIKQPV